MSLLNFDEFYISVDIETAGPNPSQYSLLSIGACSVIDPEEHFYIELQPVNDRMMPEAFAIHQLSLETLMSEGVPPTEAMTQFDSWLSGIIPSGRKPIFVAFNAPFDWMFISDYFHRYLGHNPFGHAALDIKAFYMGFHGSSWKDTAMNNVSLNYLEGKKISHNALEDACDQAQIFSRLYNRAKKPT
jgi:DNA polymerase III epsilon subunit-like protein